MSGGKSVLGAVAVTAAVVTSVALAGPVGGQTEVEIDAVTLVSTDVVTELTGPTSFGLPALDGSGSLVGYTANDVTIITVNGARFLSELPVLPVVRDLGTGVVQTVPTTDGGFPVGIARLEDLSSDGSTAVVDALAANIGEGLFLWDLATDTMTPVPHPTPDAENRYVSGGRLDADGDTVAFIAGVQNSPTDFTADAYVWRIGDAEPTLMTAPPTGGPANGATITVQLDDSGDRAVLMTQADNLVSDARPVGDSDVVLWDRAGGLSLVSSSASGGQADGPSGSPVISGDGSTVAFSSIATDLVAGGVPGSVGEAYVYDVATGTTERVFTPSDGVAEPNGDLLPTDIDADGSVIALQVFANGLDAPDANESFDAAVWDRAARRFTSVSVTADGATAKGESTLPALSADGRTVAFVSEAGDLDTTDDDDGIPDVFVATLREPETVAPVVPATGFWSIDADGMVVGTGELDAGPGATFTFRLEDGERPLALRPNPVGYGMRLLTDQGRVATVDGALNYGDLNGSTTATSLAIALDGEGYWIAEVDGTITAYGSAPDLGDLSATPLAAPVVDLVVTPSGLGLYVLTADGGVFGLGDAVYAGSLPELGVAPVAPARQLVLDPDGTGYVVVAADGGVFAFEAGFLGSVPGSIGAASLAAPVVGGVHTASGYAVVSADSGVFDYSSDLGIVAGFSGGGAAIVDVIGVG